MFSLNFTYEEFLYTEKEELYTHTLTLHYMYAFTLKKHNVREPTVTILNLYHFCLYPIEKKILTEGELRKAEVSSVVALRRVKAQRLDHEMGFEACFLQSLFHQLHCTNTRHRVQVAIYPNNVSSCKLIHKT